MGPTAVAQTLELLHFRRDHHTQTFCAKTPHDEICHIGILTADVGAASVFVHEWRALGPERRAAVLLRRDAYEARFRTRIEAGIATGALGMTDPAIASTILLTALNGVATWYEPDGRLSAGRVADHVVDLSLRMLSNEAR